MRAEHVVNECNGETSAYRESTTYNDGYATFTTRNVAYPQRIKDKQFMKLQKESVLLPPEVPFESNIGREDSISASNIVGTPSFTTVITDVRFMDRAIYRNGVTCVKSVRTIYTRAETLDIGTRFYFIQSTIIPQWWRDTVKKEASPSFRTASV